MERIFYLLKQSLFIKLALVVTLVIGGGNSVWAQKSLPYNYGFENNDLAGEGWTIISGTGTPGSATGTGIYTAYKNSGTYAFQFYNSKNPPQFLISPELENSNSGIDVSFYYKGGTTWTSSETFCVGYSTTTSDISSFDDTWSNEITTTDYDWHLFPTLSFPAGTKYIAIKYTANNKSRLSFDDFSIVRSETYKRPSNLIANSVNANSAIISWTAGSNETAWQFVYSIDDSFNPDTATPVDVTSNTYTLTKLEEGVTYYGYVRANYDGNYSAWSNKVQFTPLVCPTINDGSATNMSIPLYGYKHNKETKNQFVIPKSQLSELVNRSLTKIVFYTSTQTSINWGNATFDVYLCETDETSYTSTPTFKDWGTKVCSNASISVANKIMEVEFDNPYVYSGNNLIIGFQSVATGLSGTSTWQGVDGDNNAAYYCYSYHSTTSDIDIYATQRVSFYPKMTIYVEVSTYTSVTIGSTGYTTFVSARPLDLSRLPEGVSAYYVASDGVSNSSVKLTKVESTVAAGTGMILKGTAGESYDIPYADSGNAISGNLMVGCITPKAPDKNSAYYVLVNNDGTPEFQCLDMNGATIPAGKAYLNAPAAGARLKFVFDDDNTTTGISNLGNVHRMMDRGTYNLNGQRVDARQKGVYIVNGKKVVVK